MIIQKILNNNVVITLDVNEQEQIVMGRGIAFKRKIGDFVAEGQIDQVFRLANKDTSLKFQELLGDLPLEVMQLSDEIIKYAKTKLGRKLNDTIFISLTDHLHTALERIRQGIEVKNFLLWDIKRFFSDEYDIGNKALEMVKQKFDVQLPEDEAGFIALHIVNAEMDEEVGNVYELTKIMQEITNIVKYHFKITYNKDSVYFYRFSTHLKFFAYRLLNHKEFQDEDDGELYEVIKKKYRNAYNCVNKIADFLTESYHYTISKEEKMYLIIHIARVVQTNSQ
ncbi:transcription antiterminator LicT [Enterococcus ureilyticus]|uniref:Transcription antiterminator LicT n=1 Tax=Enterococcus ureilyticus TaxID=1131292 RepID=A0A1E5HBV0_9ENTE|nr:PRD domain-containing protein [Enterococcus ureilyticus]MBM7690573.1 beta-glucoside operon transcriptional antiterminator [Enterococcus ureilyticus]MBO0447896.1 PRD domain-containing protein [Enterococcus ureilyticus]OEG22130.1 transcription antiterminator LicT [Enterococcus ureilyticus]